MPADDATTLRILQAISAALAAPNPADIGSGSLPGIGQMPTSPLHYLPPVAEPGTTQPQTMTFPVEGGAPVSENFGELRPQGHRHAGVDINVPSGGTILAAAGGTIVDVGSEPGGYGNYVDIDHGNGLVTRYAHLTNATVQPGEQVRAGQQVGVSGSTGRSTGPHLHFEVRRDGQPVDPMPFLAGTATIVGDHEGAPLSPEEYFGLILGEISQALVGQVPTSRRRARRTHRRTESTPEGDDLDGWIRQAMRITGVDESWFAGLKRRALQESSGDPRAINQWDSNAQRGTPSKGLMQTIDPTFDAYKLPGYEDIWNPVHNLIAAIRYIEARYGHPDNLPKGGY